nr:MAG TPA: hypothetical protein [Caudoviricetes sp.]
MEYFPIRESQNYRTYMIHYLNLGSLQIHQRLI